MSTAEILSHLASHDASPEQWAALVERHGRRLWAVCRAVAGEQHADDAFQDGLIAIRRRAGRFRPGADAECSALAWMVTVTHHAALDLLRREQRQRRREAHFMDDPSTPRSVMPDPDDAEQQDREVRQAMAVLETLPERHRDVIRLRLLGGLEATQTASLLGCPIEQVRVRLHRALELLRSRCVAQRAACMPLTALEQAIRHAAAPPMSLPVAAQHLAIASFTVPVTSGLTLGAIMTISAVGFSLVTTLAVIATTLHPQRLPAAEESSAPVLVTTTAAPAPAASDEALALAIMAAAGAQQTLTVAVEKQAQWQGVTGTPDAIAAAASRAVTDDTALWHDTARVLVHDLPPGALRAFHDFLTTPSGTAYGQLQPLVQQSINSGPMQESLQQLMGQAVAIIDHPDRPLHPALDLDPALAQARCLLTAFGFIEIIKEQMAQSVLAQRPGHGLMTVMTAFDRAIEARPTWLDPVLKTCAAQLTPAQMREAYAYALTPAGRLQAAVLPTLTNDANAVIMRHFPSLIAQTRTLVATPPTPAGTATPAAAAPARSGF